MNQLNDNTGNLILNIKVPFMVILRASGLLPMFYSLRELEHELGVPYNTIRGWLKCGVPFDKDSRGRIWINGELLAKWAKEQNQPTKRKVLKENEGYCFHCDEVRIIQDAKTVKVSGKLGHIRGKCQVCGNIVFRGANIG